jgi:RNAse (barnase) inhibitor barstar
MAAHIILEHIMVAFQNFKDIDSMDAAALFSLDTPLAFKIITTEDNFANTYNSLNMEFGSAVIRMIRGKKSATVKDFFNEISAALQFPYYFGENSAALNDCITDLEWIPGSAYLLMFDNAEFLLSEAPGTELEGIFEIFKEAQQQWLTPNEYFPRERQPTPFHLLIHSTDPGCSFFTRTSEIGIALQDWKPDQAK